MFVSRVVFISFCALEVLVSGFVVPVNLGPWKQQQLMSGGVIHRMAFSDDAPSDYDMADMAGEKHVEVDEDEDDAVIRDALKRELLLLSSVTNRGEFASKEEQNIAIDLVTQLEALNPTADPAHNCEGEWNLCLSSTQLFLSSPFFQSIRIAVGDEQATVAKNGFILHDRATAAGRIGKIRQTISATELVSEVDLDLGLAPGLPISVKGTVVTTASLDIVSDELWELKVIKTQVKGSNIPFLNELLEEPQLEFKVGDVYNTVLGKTPVIPMKTFYLDEAMRITRDIDDNFFVFTRL